jgi:hypothetical protein
VLTLVAVVLLQGVVRIGPTSPACHAATRCDKPAAHVTLSFSRAGKVVKAKTDGAGRYRVSLDPGSWTVHASVGRSITPSRFFLLQVHSTRRNFLIDTGLR